MKPTHLLLVIILLANFASADMLQPGMKPVGYCFTIENQLDFPDYVFLAYGEPLFDEGVISPGSCTSFYKHSLIKVYAIKESDFDPTLLQELRTNSRDQDGYEQLKDYFENNSLMKKSGLVLRNYGFVSDHDPLQSAKDVLKIVQLDENSFVIQKEKVVYTYTDGSREEKYYSFSEDVTELAFPKPDQSSILPWWIDSVLGFGGIILSVLALIVMILLIIKKRRA